MSEELPTPASRTESYLAKAAGEDVTIPEKPESRLEQYLEAIAENGGGGGGGGTSNFNQLTNRPKYNGVTMTGSTNIPQVKTYTAGSGVDITGNAISVDTTTIQPKLTAGSNISIADNTISATDTTYSAGTNVQISSGNVISATDTTYSAFTGTDGTAAGTAGLVPAPATTDAGKFLKADGTWDIAGGGGGGSIIELTSADYNYHSSGGTDDGVAIWKLASGVYCCKDGVKIYYNNNGNNSTQASVYIVNHENNYPSAIQYAWSTVQGDQTGGAVWGYTDNTGTVRNPNSANLILTQGSLQQTGGSGTTTVMSQNATTSMVFQDPSTKRTIQIGDGASASNNTEGIAIGRNSKANGTENVCVGKGSGLNTTTSNHIVAIGSNSGYEMSGASGSVSLGAYSKATRVGEVNVGSTQTTYGFNSTNYRVIGGVHDGQDAHDATTVGQVNTRLGGLTLLPITQTAYDTLATKDANTLYVITGA